MLLFDNSHESSQVNLNLNLENSETVTVMSKPRTIYENSLNSLPVPKMNFQTDVLKQNINSDVVKKELTLEEKNVDEAPVVNDASFEKPDVRSEKKNLIYLEDNNDYARVDSMVLGKKPDRYDLIKKKALDKANANMLYKSYDSKRKLYLFSFLSFFVMLSETTTFSG